MPRRGLTAVAVAGALCLPALLAPAPALAGGTPGTRSIVSVVPGAMTSALGQHALTGSLSVQVAETAVTGDPSWYVTAQATSFSDGATPPHTLPASALANGSNATVLVGGGGTVAEGGTGSLDNPVTLFSDSGESATSLYSGTYTNTSTLTLTPPNGTFAPTSGATYTSVITVTLIN